MNRCIAEVWSCAATPTKVTLPSFSFAAAAMSSASPWHLGHHGVQNQNTTGLPARLSPEKSLPSTVLAVNFSCSGTFTGTGAAPGALASTLVDVTFGAAAGASLAPHPAIAIPAQTNSTTKRVMT